MAGKGFAPKDPGERRRRNADPVPGTQVQADGRLRGPALPPAGEVLKPGEVWHPMTVRWWTTWRRSAQARSMSPTAWESLLSTAMLHHLMWASGRHELAGEIRLREAKHGATLEDQLRLRMQVLPSSARERATEEREQHQGDVPAAPDRTVTDIASRRERLTS